MKNQRKSGVLMHISSLPGEYSIGSFGAEARRFVDYLAEGGFSFWQVLPLCMTDDCNSPYKSVSAFGANPYFIDLPTLYEKGLLTSEELRRARQVSPYLCEFERLKEERLALLYAAAMRVNDRSAIIDYVKSVPELDRSAHFLAIRDKNGGAPWYEWESEEFDTDTLFFRQFIEYEFLTQWESLKEYANSRGISVIGDLPIYVSHDSCEVWAEPEQFLLDSRKMPTSVAGVPPDYFSSDGQLWGNPLYDWKHMKEDGYDWWRRRLKFTLRMFDGVRIDHFRGFEAFFSIPASAKSAKEGKWVKGPGKPFIRALRDVAEGKLIIAEDLGDVTDGVRALLEYSGFPGMRVFQFGFLGGENSTHMPHNYPALSVAYTGTHDNNTLLGYVWELPSDTRKRVLNYCSAPEENWERGCQDIIRTVMRSHAGIAILPIQDIMVYGADTRMNTPGTGKNNWAWRITGEQLRSFPKEKMLEINTLYGRVGSAR